MATATARTAIDGGATARHRHLGLDGMTHRRREHRLGTADAIVYATARHVGAELPACDAHFEGLPEVALFPRRA